MSSELSRPTRVRNSRLSVAALLADNSSDGDSTSVIEIKKKRSKSKDVTKKLNAKKASSSPDKPKRAKSKSPARSKSPGRVKKEKEPKVRRTTSPKVTRGAKLYIKKDLVQEIAPAEAPARRTLRSESNRSSTSELVSIMKAEVTEAPIETPKEVVETKCDGEFLVSIGCIKLTRCCVSKLVLLTMLLMLVITIVGHLTSNSEFYGKQIEGVINSVQKCGTDFKGKLSSLKSKFF